MAPIVRLGCSNWMIVKPCEKRMNSRQDTRSTRLSHVIDPGNFRPSVFHLIFPIDSLATQQIRIVSKLCFCHYMCTCRYNVASGQRCLPLIGCWLWDQDLSVVDAWRSWGARGFWFRTCLIRNIRWGYNYFICFSLITCEIFGVICFLLLCLDCPLVIVFPRWKAQVSGLIPIYFLKYARYSFTTWNTFALCTLPIEEPPRSLQKEPSRKAQICRSPCV